MGRTENMRVLCCLLACAMISITLGSMAGVNNLVRREALPEAHRKHGYRPNYGSGYNSYRPSHSSGYNSYRPNYSSGYNSYIPKPSYSSGYGNHHSGYGSILRKG